MTPCSVPACSRPRHGRGLCQTHYSRWRKHGDPLALLRPGVRDDPENAFRKKVRALLIARITTTEETTQ